MPNRYIRESAIESESVNSLSWMGEIFYRRLLNRADDFGRFTANTALLRASIFPLQLEKVPEADVSRLLTECEQSGLLFQYTADGKATLVLNRWEKGRAKESRYPAPPPFINERMKTYVYMCKHMSPTPTPTPTTTPTTTPIAGRSEIAAGAATAAVDLFGDNLPEDEAAKIAAEKAKAERDAAELVAAQRAAALAAQAEAARMKSATDADWLDGLKRNPAYEGIDVLREHAKAAVWCENKRRTLSRARFINWLNRAERPMAGRSTMR